MHDVDGVNAGYARLLLDEYLDNPESVSPEWRALFESGETDLLLSLPGLARLLDVRPNGHGNGQAAVAAPPEPAPAAPDNLLLGAVAAAMALVKAFRMHGHLAARLDPPGSAPVGDPPLHPRVEPATRSCRRDPGLDPASRRRRSACRRGPACRRRGSMAYEIEHIFEHEQRVWLQQAIESWRFRNPLNAKARRLYTRL